MTIYAAPSVMLDKHYPKSEMLLIRLIQVRRRSLVEREGKSEPCFSLLVAQSNHQSIGNEELRARGSATLENVRYVPQISSCRE